MNRILPSILLAASALAACDHDHDEAAAEPAGGVVTLWTDSTELFMEHPALIVNAPDRFAVHFTDLSDFTPIRSGRLTLRFTPRDGGAPVLVVQDTPRAPGIYGPAPSFTRPGVYDLVMLLESPQARDSIAIPGLPVYASVDAAPKDTAGDEAGGISFLKEQQWKTPGFRTVFAEAGTLSGTIEATGQITPAAGRHAEVTAPIPGLLDASSVAAAPAPGQRVGIGQVLAFINPSLGESGSSYAEARAQLREAEDEYERARRLVAAEAAPRRRLHEAEIRLDAARSALAGLGGEGGRVAIRSPIAGEVTRRSLLPGSRVDAGASLFTIVDPSVVWLVVNVPAASAGGIAATPASFTVEGSPRMHQARRVVSVGSVIDQASRTLPVIYEVANAGGAIKVGANARALVRTAMMQDGVIIPASAVLDENGRPIAFVQVDGETFERRDIVLGARDSERVLVTSGIQPGERVVSGAAYQVRLASLSTAVPAHGHEH